MTMDNEESGAIAVKVKERVTKTTTKKKKTNSVTTVATTTKKGNKHGDGIANKEREQMIKIMMRRLPAQITQEEFWEQLQPLPAEPSAFWFCRANPGFRPYSLSSAYIAFKEEKDAFSFAERFNGYVFVDKHGNESMAIVECAPNQYVPKDMGRTAKECDPRSGTLENELQYQQFLAQYEAQLTATGTRALINFDELVRELEEKQRRIEAGHVQQTPLTAYINQLTQDKGTKKQQRQMERLERKLQVQRSLMPATKLQITATTDWTELYRKAGADSVTPVPRSSEDNTGGGDTKEKKMRKRTGQKGKTVTKEAAKKDDVAFRNRDEANERKENHGVKERKRVTNGTENGEEPNSVNGTAKKERTRISRTGGKKNKQEADENKIENGVQGNGQNQAAGEKKLKQQPKKAGVNKENSISEEADVSGKSSTTPKAKKSPTSNSHRNKDRPEREIYRPGMSLNRTQPKKTTNIAEASSAPKHSSPDTKQQQQK